MMKRHRILTPADLDRYLDYLIAEGFAVEDPITGAITLTDEGLAAVEEQQKGRVEQ